MEEDSRYGPSFDVVYIRDFRIHLQVALFLGILQRCIYSNTHFDSFTNLFCTVPSNRRELSRAPMQQPMSNGHCMASQSLEHHRGDLP